MASHSAGSLYAKQSDVTAAALRGIGHQGALGHLSSYDGGSQAVSDMAAMVSAT